MAMTQLMTAKDLAQLPDDGYQYELIRGELIRMPPASSRHSARAMWVGHQFLIYVNVHGGLVTGPDGGFQIEVDPDTVVAPDVAYIRADRVPPDEELDRYARLAPDVVVEILSPSDRPGQLRERIALYREVGVRLTIITDPRRRRVSLHYQDGEVIELAEDDTFDGGEVMPGFRLPVAEFLR
ncbi:MAG: Uma2 family endonuclease [Thermomicrobiales bacterium]